jgi:AraC family transcriptional regulator
MNWTKIIEDALSFIEENITEDLTVGRIAGEVNTSAFYFQKGFSMLCGYTVAEYVRMRRLSLAGEELVSSDIKVIDLAMKYGYDSADSFTKAFTRFHGSTPTDVRQTGASIKAFAPLHIKLSLDGGKTMEYKIEKKPAFKVMGVSKLIGYGNGYSEIPKFWDEVFAKPENKLMGMYGVCLDDEVKGDQFRYLIADDYNKELADSENYEIKEIPSYTWAVFPCRGAMPQALQSVNTQVFNEWLPASSYEIAAGFNIEFYTDETKYKLGAQDPDYYSEIWVPIKA